MDLKTLLCEKVVGFDPEKCFGLVIAAKSVKHEADNVYGFCLSDNKGNLRYVSLFGEGVPDSTMAYDRVNSFQIMPTVSFVEAYAKLLNLLPKDAVVFSAYAARWATVIFKDIPVKFPAAPIREDLKHVDIVNFCKAIDAGFIPDGDLVEFSIQHGGGKRISLDTLGSMNAIPRDLSVTGPEERAIIIGKLIDKYFGKELKEG